MFHIPFSRLDAAKIIKLSSEKLNDNLDEWEKNIWKFISDWFDDSRSSITVYTSGSTGAPKEIVHSKHAVQNSAKLSCEALRLSRGGNALLCLPASKISGMMMIVRCIYNKTDLFYIRPSANPLQAITNQQKFNFAAFTPMQLFGIDHDLIKFHRVENIHRLIIGGEDIPAPLLKSLGLMNNEAYSTFGMTETISHIALRRLNGADAGYSYKTLNGITVFADERNCLVVEAPALQIHHLVTNDVVKLISSSEFEWLGRIDNVVNSGGIKLYPEKIEELLKLQLSFAFFVTGIQSERTGQEVAIVIEKSSVSPAESEDLKMKFEKLDKLYRPKTILCIDQFVRTDNGKIKRKESLEKCAAKMEI